jgi:MerR family transcriptional regulator, light-induced transcriptional regulator
MPVYPLRHRIGAVSAMSGVPVPTLRAWELRHGAFSPQKSDGQHRLYSDDDALKASLLKQLTDAGHAIGTLAALDVGELSALWQRQRSALQPAWSAATPTLPPLALAVVGTGLASRIQSNAFPLRLADQHIQLTQVMAELPGPDAPTLQGQPQVLLVRLNTLHLPLQQRIQQLVERHAIGQVLVLYSFGPDKVVQALKLAGMSVRREPMTDADLADWLQQARNHARAPQHTPALQPAGVIPPRKYSDQTLAEVARMASNLCECPRHVAELITQLAHFEQYSRECLQSSPEDAQLHAYLGAVSGSARALFERALEMVAQHEGIALDK